MKKFLSLSGFLLLFFCLVSATTEAQQKFSPKGVFKKDSTIYQHNGIAWMHLTEESVDSLTTTDSALNTIKTIHGSANEVGILRVSVVGLNDSLVAAVTGVLTVRYAKVNGTLTLGTPTSSLALETDAALGTATWDITTSGNKIIIRVKGKLTYTVRWEAHVQKFSKRKLT